MKSYLDLVFASAKVRRRQNRMTILCIVISVFLVTAIFSIADMMQRTQVDRMTDKNGSWHFSITGLTAAQADEIAARPDVTAVGRMGKFNEGGEGPYRLNDKRVEFYGLDEAALKMQAGEVAEGAFPQSDGEALIGTNTAKALGLAAGDHVTLQSPAGERQYTISGIGGVDETYYNGQFTLMDLYLIPAAFSDLLAANGVEPQAQTYYVTFTDARKAAAAMAELPAQYGLSQDAVSENRAIMGIQGQSSDGSWTNIYGVVFVLFFVVLLAGVLMISGSMNSNVAQRTQFFGMMRCIGMSRRQVIRFVRLEALNWCKTAVPLGLLLGTAVGQVVCFALRYGIGGEFSTTPVLTLSPIGLVSGVLVGVITVLLAAQAPAKRAAKVSPVAAISGGQQSTAARRPVHLGGRRIEVALGIYHAVASTKNWLLMTASFALSIVLALCFSVLLTFAGVLLPALSPWQPDIAIGGYLNAQVVTREMADQLRTLPGVTTVWGAASEAGVPITTAYAGVDTATVCSYDEVLMDASQSELVRGKMADATGAANEVMTIYNRNNPLRVGDTVTVNGSTLTIVGAYSAGLYSDEVTLICPAALYDCLMGEQDYNICGIKLADDVPDSTIARIVALSTDEMIVTDMRTTNAQSQATFLAARVVMYSFLGIIGLISLLNIINSISMSVTARARQYGAMRAVGMDDRQLTRMIAAEGAAYAVSGLTVGLAVGLPLQRMLYTRLVTRYFGLDWTLPLPMVVIAIVFVAAAAALAVRAPAKRLCGMPITAAINEL